MTAPASQAAALQGQPPVGGSRVFRGLVAVRTLGAFADSAMLPFIVLWARHDVGLSGAIAGLLFLAQAVGELFGGLAGGMLADRLGHRRVLLVATAGMAAGYGSLFAIDEPALAIGAFFVAGLFESAFHPTIAALVADLRSGPELHRAYGTVRVGANVGNIGGPLLGAAAVMVSLATVFAVVGALLVATVAVIAFTIPPDRDLVETPGDYEPDVQPSSLRTLLRDRRLALLVLSGGVLAITFTWFEADGLVLLRQQHSLGTSAYAALFAVAAAATVAFQLPSTRLARRWTPRKLLFIGAIVQGAGLLALAGAGIGYVLLIGAVLLMALGQMLYAPTVSAFTSRLAAPGHIATYQAALSTTEDIGTAIGPTTGLALGGLGGSGLIWLLAGPLCLLAALGSAHASHTGS
jgi:MFS transporter, FSR family, fosmidomycin resistance protein